MNNFEAIVIGVSAGGMNAIHKLISCLKVDLQVPVIIAQHLHPNQTEYFIEFFQKDTPIPVVSACDKTEVQPGTIYFAPPDYHLLLDDKHTLSLAMDEKVNFSRPSIDLLFDSAAEVFGANLIGILMTGANNDGARGLKKIKHFGGLTIVQSPESAEYSVMPQSAIDLFTPDHVLEIPEIAFFVNNLQEINCSYD